MIGLFQFNIFSQTVAIELEKMNVFYISVDNPIKVVMQGYPCDKIVLKSKYGNLKPAGDSCHYIYRNDSCNTFTESISVGVLNGKSIRWVDTMKYRLKRIPDPVIYIAGSKCGTIDRKLILITGGPIAKLDNMDIDITFQVSHYSVEIKRADSIIYKEVNIKGGKWSNGLITEIKKSMTGDKYFFYDVEVASIICNRNISGPILRIE